MSKEIDLVPGDVVEALYETVGGKKMSEMTKIFVFVGGLIVTILAGMGAPLSAYWIHCYIIRHHRAEWWYDAVDVTLIWSSFVFTFLCLILSIILVQSLFGVNWNGVMAKLFHSGNPELTTAKARRKKTR